MQLDQQEQFLITGIDTVTYKVVKKLICQWQFMDDRDFEEVYCQGCWICEVINKCVGNGIIKQSITPSSYSRKVEAIIWSVVENRLSQKVHNEQIPITIITDCNWIHQQNREHQPNHQPILSKPPPSWKNLVIKNDPLTKSLILTYDIIATKGLNEKNQINWVR